MLYERPMSDFGSRFKTLGRASYELQHDELETFRTQIQSSSSSLCGLAQQPPAALPARSRVSAEFATWKANHPSVLEHFDEFVALTKGKRIAVFTDYDGTLTPIVKNPDKALMSDQMRAAVRAVACLFPTSIISGRGREKVQDFVQLKELFYAGSHGMDIVGPKGATVASLLAEEARHPAPTSPFSSPPSSPRSFLAVQHPSSPFAFPQSAPLPPPASVPLTPNCCNHSPPSAATSAAAHGQRQAHGQAASEEQLAFQPAAKYAPIMDAVYDALCQRVKAIPGATVEHNKFCVSVHFRNCAAESYEAVVQAVKDTLQEQPNLKASRGRKVLEIQPQVDWGKGRALAHMLVALGLDEADDVVPIYLGDDRTDEDAFKVLKERSTGLGILISSKAKPTEAKFTLSDPSEVMAFLTQLVLWGRTAENGWHANQSCTGWALRASPQASSPFLPASRQSSSNGTTPGVTHTHSSDTSEGLAQAASSDSPFTSLPSTSGHAETGEQQSIQEPKHGMHIPSPGTAAVEEHQPARDTHGQPDPSRGLQPYTRTPLDHSQTDGHQDSSLSPGQGAEASDAQADGLQSSDFDRSAAQSHQGHSSSRTSLDHYLSAEPSAVHQSTGPAPDVAAQQRGAAPPRANSPGFGLDKNGERLTALLLEKLHGHDTHPTRQAEVEEAASPPALTSNDSGSMAGYRSPFESLASYTMQDEGDSIHAEHGSAASLSVMPSVDDHAT